MRLSSPEFNNNEMIPMRFTCQGENLSPPLVIDDIPDSAKTLALIMDDPDAATDPHGPGHTYDHWVLWEIPADTTEIPEGSHYGQEGLNGSGKLGYTGPCPPTGTHRYYFRVYALDYEPAVDGDVSKNSLIEAMAGHIIEEAELVGLYEKS